MASRACLVLYMKHVELVDDLQGYSNEFHFIMLHWEKSFAEYFKGITLFQM